MTVLLAPDRFKRYQTSNRAYDSDEFGFVTVTDATDLGALKAQGCVDVATTEGAALAPVFGLSSVGSSQATILATLGLRRTSSPTTLSLPSPYASIASGMVHPSAVYIPGGWNGYNRWMAITPYPNATDDYENPSILVSNDGETWIAPPGVTNPLVAAPADVGAGGYNSDVHLLLSPDGSKLYLLYRQYQVSPSAVEMLKLMESSDGRTWTTPQTIYSVSAATRRVASPSMWWDGSQYVIVGHDVLQSNNPLVRFANGSSDPYAGWSAPSNVTMAHPSSGSWWHSFFLRLPDGRIMGLVQDGSSAGGNLYLADSSDNGLTFAVADFDQRGGFYRSCFTVVPDAFGVSAEVYEGRVSGTDFSVRRSLAKFDRPAVKVAEASTRGAILYGAANGLNLGALSDTFQRSDGASLGTAMSGQSYTVDTGSFGISTKRAYSTNTGNCRALVDLSTGGQDVSVFVRFDTIGTQGYFIFRASDTSNYWRIGQVSGGTDIVLQKIVSGSVESGASTLGPSSYYGTKPIQIIARGPRIQVLVDGEPLIERTDTPTTSQTKVGLQAAGASATYFAELQAVKI